MTELVTLTTGNHYSDAGEATRDMREEGWRIWELPMLKDILLDVALAVTSASGASASAAAAAASAISAASQAAALLGTSTTSLAVSVGTKNITTQAGKAWQPGQYLTLIDASNPANTITGPVVSYSGTSLQVAADAVGGAGTIADWVIVISGKGTKGDKGDTGATGAQDLTYAAKTANYTVVAVDKASLISCTGSFTLTFSAPGTLTNKWWAYVFNAGTGEVTLAHTSGNIDGLTSYKSYPGELRLIQCDGTTLRSWVLKGFYLDALSSLTFTKPPGYTWAEGFAWSAGASAGRRGDNSNGAGGGGAGGCLPFRISMSAFGATENIVIGDGGLPRTGSAQTGQDGGDTSIGSLLIVYGGKGGIGTSGSGGAGGGARSGVTGNGGGLFGAPANNPGGYGGGGGGNGGGSADLGSVYGGGGGAGVNGSGTPDSGPRDSKFGGAGGAASDSGNGSPGAQPGGGGGATRTGTQSGAGGAGEVRMWGVI